MTGGATRVQMCDDARTRDGPAPRCRSSGSGRRPLPGLPAPAIVSPTPSQGGASPLGSSPPRRGSPTMHFTLRIDGTAAHITVHGEIDYTTLPTLRAATAG